jgi:HIV Tat-specific factor 1
LEEVNDVFKKFGLITEEIDTGKPRIKMYKDEAGNFKGDALIVYFRSESVNIAIQMLDETDFRFGVTGPDGPMRVQAADTAWKSEESNQKPLENPTQTTRSKTDQRKIAERAKRLNEYVDFVEVRG